MLTDPAATAAPRVTPSATGGGRAPPDRDNMPYHYQPGWTLEESGRDAQAIAEFTAGLKAQPDYAWALLRRACVQARTGQRAEALADSHAMIEILSLYPAESLEAQRDLTRGQQIAARLEAGADHQAIALCARLAPGEEPRARSTLLPARIDWLSRTPPPPRGLAALSPNQFRLLVLAVLALVVGAAVVLLRRFS